MRKLLLVDGQLVCRNLNCRICARAKGPEWIAIHTDCYHLYRSCAELSESKAHDLLFMIASWRNPWTGAEPMYLDPGINQAELIKVSEKFQLPHLQKLPMELLDMIRKEQPHVAFWRFQFVISLSPSIKLPQSPLQKKPLGEIFTWKRGESPKPGPSTPLPPLVRLTINVHGIQSIQRLHKQPEYDGHTRKSLGFIVEHTTNLSDITVEFKGDCFARLCQPHRKTALPIWNTSSPPLLCFCYFIKSAVLNSGAFSRLCINDLQRCRGITFFISKGKLFGVYNHQTEDSCAADAYKQISISDYDQKCMVWVHVPIAQKDKLISLGYCPGAESKQFDLLMQMECAGKVIVGLSNDKFVRLGSGIPTALLYDEPRENEPITMFGAYIPSPYDLAPLSLQVPEKKEPRNYFSWAPLGGIKSANVFYHTHTQLCAGIVFQYHNRGSRAIGQCRLGVDRSMMVLEPRILCFQNFDRRVQVKVGSDDTHEHGDEWECLSLDDDGAIAFSFNYDSSYISFIRELSMVADPAIDK
ncbi:hypothetical protein F5Y09DRAFT_334008 [Xylaria sp. FL1042]|nr:hypothetical protein F5Y09DRAFT_334008 [Xylaria sp. FL1042]